MSNAIGSFASSACKLFISTALLSVGTLGCGSDSSRVNELKLLTPAPDQVLTMADDIDPNAEGLQLDVTGQSVGLREGTPIDLYIDGDDFGVEGEIGDDDTITLEAVTLPPGEHRIHLVTSVGEVKSDDMQKYTFRALVIDSPDDGDVVADSDGDEEGVQARVVVEGFALEGDGEVTLFVDDDELRSLTLDGAGRAVFSGVTLAPGSHTLQARSGSGDGAIESEEIDVQVTAESCPSVSFVAPVGLDDGDVVLGGARCPSSGPFTTRFEIATEARDGTSMQLTLGGEVVATTEVEDGAAVFEDVELSTAEPNQLAVSFENVSGMVCATAFPSDVLVDCDSPSCAFRAPVPYTTDGDDTLYLGAAQVGDDGIDIEVQAGEGAVGETVTLVIDEEEGDALTATAENDGGDAVATFDGVDLADGAHTLTARCRDNSGNVTSSSVSFVVDTAACGVSITSPEDGALFLPDDDADADEGNGVQVAATTAVDGDDCTGRRVALCDGELPDGDFASFDGTTPFDTSLTLEDAGELEVCVEIQDRAGNVARASRSFVFRDAAPLVQIESPSDGDDFNALGNGDYERDNDRSDGSLAVCDAEVWVACTEIGTDVALHRDSAEGTVFATGECEAPDPSDAAPPDGFTGRAKIQTILDDGDEATTIVATQTLMGSSSSLRGDSTSIDVGTDCLVPGLTVVQSPCTLHASMQVPFSEADDLTVVVADDNLVPDIAAASLSFTNDATSVGPLEPDALNSGTVSFDEIDFTQGLTPPDEGPLTVTITVDDNFANRAEHVCASALVNDLPEVLSFTEPPDESEFGPGEQTCGTTVAGEYRLAVLATIDQSADRTVSVLVNGEVVLADVTLEDTAIDTCVSMPDDMENDTPGPSTITVRADSDLGIGFDLATHTVSVNTLAILDPQPDDLITSADDCPGGAFDYEVTIAVDPLHDGAEYTLSSGAGDVTGTVSGSTIVACVPFDVGGPRTLTASIDGTSIEYSVDVVVVDDTPQIVSFEAPDDEQEFGVGDATCDPAGGGFGVLVQATIDQADNREATLLVNGVALPTAIEIDEDDATIEVCVALPDDLNHTPNGPSTITLELDAVLGSGNATESVTVMVDTLDIVDPEADQVLLSGDDCDDGPGFGYEVELAVDPSHEGRGYALNGGAGMAVGTIDDSGTISDCVSLTVGGERTIMASITGTTISESVSVETLDDTPSIVSITAPTSGASFAIDGSECDAGAGNYGIDFVATVDQATNREADILVNGVEVLNNVEIVGTTVTACVPLPDNMTLTPDGASTITLELSAVVGDGDPATASVTANLDTLEIDSPLTDAVLLAANDCDPSPSVFGAQLVADVDPAHNGRSYTITGGSSSATGTIGDGAISHCVNVPVGTDITLTLTIDGTGISESRSFETLNDTPEIVSIDAPTSSTYGIGEQDCSAGAGNYGVTFTATVDQQENRRADILVNGVNVASDAAISGAGLISVCVPVPDDFAHTPNGISTITLNLTAEVGAGSDTGSVTVSVDTFDLIAPVDEQTITSSTDCDGDPGVDFDVVFNADLALTGAEYTISGGSSLITGIIAGTTVTRCVPFDAGDHIVTVSIDDTDISQSVDVSVEADSPAVLTFTSPLDSATYGVGDQDCDAGPGTYGVLVTATIDQTENREVDILVNGGVVADNVTITADAISQCIAVPDNFDHAPSGASTITVRVEEEPGTRSDSQTRSIDVSTFEITAPVAAQVIGVGDTCTGVFGYGYLVTVDVDEALDTTPYSIAFNGGATAGGTVSGAQISACVPVSDGTGNFVVTVNGIARSVAASVFVSGPSAGIVIDALDAPGATDPDHRDGVTVSWPQPEEDVPGQLVRYELRCDATALLASATEEDKQTWWDEALLMTLPPGLTPDDADPSVFYEFRPEEAQHCLVRTFDGDDQGSPITQTRDVTLRLRLAVIDVGEGAIQLGIDVEPAGDIDGDNIQDMIASGFGYAAIYFGRTTGFTGSPDAEITTLGAFGNLSVAGIGDFNDDGFDDFAIGDSDWDDPIPGNGRGRVSIFFGRPDRGAFDGVDLSGACAADLCVNHDEELSTFGLSLAAAGDFDADGFNDLAVGTDLYPFLTADGQVAVISGDTYQTRSCDDDGDCRGNESCVANACELDSDAFWGLEVGFPSGTYVGNAPVPGTELAPRGFFHTGAFEGVEQLGLPIVGVGNIDGVAGDDLIVSARGVNQVRLLSGQPDGVGFVEVAAMTVISTNAGQALPQNLWGFAVGSVGDFYDPAGAFNPGANDLLIAGSLGNRPHVVPGERLLVGTDPVFSALEVTLAGTNNMGQAVANSLHPTLGLLGDIDGDDVPEIALGSRAGDDITMWYADTFAAAVADTQPVNEATASRITVATTELVNVQYVGDINGDGHLDIAVGDPGLFVFDDPAASDDGRVLLLY
jgi:hypothetical protein